MKPAIIPVYRRVCQYNICLQLLILISLYSNVVGTFIISHVLIEGLVAKFKPISQFRHVKPGKALISNLRLTSIYIRILVTANVITWFSIHVLLLCSGDIHPNPGPSSISSPLSTSYSSNSSSISTDIIYIGNYEVLRDKAQNTDWDSLRDDNLDTYATNISNSVLAMASECIPNKHITVIHHG